MAGILKTKNKKSMTAKTDESSAVTPELDNSLSDIEKYSTEVLQSLILDNLPPTPNNFSLYFDRLLEEKSDNLKKQIVSILEIEDTNDDETTIELEKSLKQGFVHVKKILSSTATLYKNMSLMMKILEKRKEELSKNKDTRDVINTLEGDISKLNSILKTQTTHMKTLYDDTATIVKNVENETIFDNQFGVYNKRYLLSKIEKEISLVERFEHKSSLIVLELSKELKQEIQSEKAIRLMTRTIARLLLKTSRRSDIVAYYGNGMFSVLLRHTDIESAKKASERLCYLVSNSNFFLSDKEVNLRIAIGVTDIDAIHSVEEIIISAINAIEKAYKDKDHDYAVELRI